MKSFARKIKDLKLADSQSSSYNLSSLALKKARTVKKLNDMG